jgi:TIR domain
MLRSFCSKDKPFVRKLVEALKKHLLNVWVDEHEIKVGDSLVGKISEALWLTKTRALESLGMGCCLLLVVSIPNTLHVLQEHLLAAAIIELRCAAVSVAGDPLSGFKSAVIFQKIRDTSRPK